MMTSSLANPIFKVLSALLSYPTEELVDAGQEIAAHIASREDFSAAQRKALMALCADLQGRDLYELQERYVEHFDRSRKRSLHLFEHVHGESRDRGQAMVDLAKLYESNGLTLAANELPDYLPLFLEYLATLPAPEGCALLADTSHILAVLRDRLADRHSPYAAVFVALLFLADRPAAIAEAAPEAEIDDLASLDAAWEETAVTFGPGEDMAGCSNDRLRMRIRAGRRSANIHI